MKDPDPEGCKFLPLPPDEHRRQLKKKRSCSSVPRAVLVFTGVALTAGWLTWLTLRGGPQQLKASSFGLTNSSVQSVYMERGRRNMGREACHELGSQLETFDSFIFDHMSRKPQCLDQIKPTLTLFTRGTPTQGCSLTQQDPSVGSSYYDIPGNCHDELYDLPKVVFLVHGFALFNSQLDEYTDMKTKILEHDNNTGVIIVDWYEGAKLDLRVLHASTAATILADFINMGPYHQAAANTRYIGAALAVVTENIRNVTVTDPVFHCIGHSLGAHACGFLGKALKKISAEPLSRITGLDPAGPLFLKSQFTVGMGVPSYSTSSRLAAEDAILVDTIHTDSTWLGAFTKTGHQDFYVGESKINEDQTKEDTFGYNQPGANECFMGSHSLSKNIFSATMQEETCNVETVCNNINENITESCQNVVDVKFGYNMDGASTLNGSFPVSSDRNSIKCAHGKNINIEVNQPPALMKILAYIKADVCSLIHSIVAPIRELGQLINVLKERSEKKLVAKKVALQEQMDKMMDLGTGLDGDKTELYDIYREMQDIVVLHEEERNVLNQLAAKTKRTSGKMVRALKEIMNQENGTRASVDIKYVLVRVSNLIEYSNTRLQQAEKTLKEISVKYGHISTRLKSFKDKIKTWKTGAAEFTEKLKSGIATTKAEQTTVYDFLNQMVGSQAGIQGLLWAIPSGGISLVAVPIGAIVLIHEHFERFEEEETINLFEATLSEIEAIQNQYDDYSNALDETASKVKGKQRILEGRKRILSLWHEVVQTIIMEYGDNDYNELKDAISSRNTFLLKEAITDFELLGEKAQDYINYEKTTI